MLKSRLTGGSLRHTYHRGRRRLETLGRSEKRTVLAVDGGLKRSPEDEYELWDTGVPWRRPEGLQTNHITKLTVKN